MPTNGKRNNNNRRSRRARNGPLLQQMSKLVQLNQQQIDRPAPDVLDIPRVLLKRNKVYTFSQTVQYGTISYTTVAPPTSGIQVFALSDLGNLPNLSALFRQFRLSYVELNFEPASSNGTGLSTVGFPPLYTALIVTQSSPPSTLADLLQYQTVQSVPFGSFVQRRLKPVPPSSLTADQYVRNPWLDTSAALSGWSGVAYSLGGVGPTALNGWTLTATIHAQFRNPF